MGQTFEAVDEILSLTMQMKAIKKCFPELPVYETTKKKFIDLLVRSCVAVYCDQFYLSNLWMKIPYLFT